MAPMRSWLRWMLVVSVVASGLALLWPDGVTQAISRSEVAIAGAQAAADIALEPRPFALISPPPAALPHRLPVHALEPADFDPFVGLQPPPAPPPRPSATVLAAAPPAAPPVPPTPTAPPLNYRYLGQMIDPAGTRLVYLGRADKEVPVAVGTQLDEGYVVDAINANGIQLRYPPLDTRAVISIPPTEETASR